MVEFHSLAVVEMLPPDGFCVLSLLRPGLLILNEYKKSMVTAMFRM